MSKYLLSTLPSAAICATAQEPKVPTNVPSIRFFAAAPKGFDPLKGPPKSYSSHGFRPSPSRPRMPKLFEVWQKAVTNGKTHVQPTLERTVNLLNLRKSAQTPPADSNAIATYSSN